ncbi:DUF1266 domain-containing protein [Aeromonas enteropelogenes]|uniref:DUF1266 domain-containing protein n=1 Tax=Aeromonas enteropelogenes TaxID=29489 RepID=UPI001CBBFE09|nr:DUF1266 domain-containing protein [Aeromonas enteropelogenes]UAK73348.1 DUF1266 domain-containing protein [Aeromonas enteropelogenes]
MLNSANLAPHERWWLTLSSPQIGFQTELRDYLKPTSLIDGIPEDDDVGEGWGISDRLGLHRQIIRLANGNTHGGWFYQDYCRFFCQLPSQWQAIRDSQTSPKYQAQLDFVAETAPYIGSGGIHAWDYGRAAFLVREGLRLGWVSDEEFAFIHNYLSHQARRHYNSWLQYTQAWYAGRSIWLLSLEEDDTPEVAAALLTGWIAKDTRNRFRNTLNDTRNPIHGQGWHDVALPDIEAPESLTKLLDNDAQE